MSCLLHLFLILLFCIFILFVVAYVAGDEGLVMRWDGKHWKGMGIPFHIPASLDYALSLNY